MSEEMAARLRPEWLDDWTGYMESLDAEFEQYERSIHQDGFAAGYTAGQESAHDQAVATAEAREAVIRQMREALAWYADEDNYNDEQAPGRKGVIWEWEFDLGSKARAALAAQHAGLAVEVDGGND